MKSLFAFSAIVLAVGGVLMADSAAPLHKKTVAIVYEQKENPSTALFHKSFGSFEQLAQAGKLKSAKLGVIRTWGEVINIQTPTDNTAVAQIERENAIIKVGQGIVDSGALYTARFDHRSENAFFGDKSLGYILNPYDNCYSEKFLTGGLTNSGYEVVGKDENPEIIVTIGLSVCLAEGELREYISKKTSFKSVQTAQASTPPSKQQIGDDLIRAGSSAQLSVPQGSGNAGVAVAGIGIALNMANWLLSPSPQQEHDFIRYHLKVEEKGKKTLELYPFAFTKSTHNVGKPINIGAYKEPENLLFTSIVTWEKSDDHIEDKLPPSVREADFITSFEMMINKK